MLEGRSDVAGALAAYQRAIDSGHPEWAPAAARDLGNLLWRQGDVAGARAAFQRAIAFGHPRGAPDAARRLQALNMGVAWTEDWHDPW